MTAEVSYKGKISEGFCGTLTDYQVNLLGNQILDDEHPVAQILSHRPKH